MFKFIHAADVHLDSPLRGLARYESAPSESIRDACRRAFENLVDLAIEEKVAFVLLSGDLYDGDWNDYSTGIFFSRQMGRLNDHKIRVFTAAGNHDAANRITKALENPPNVKMLSSSKPETIKLDELMVAIHGQSFKEQHVYDNLAKDFPAAVPGFFNIGLLHTSLDGREGHASYAPCSKDDLTAKGYQYWALGHIHKQEYVSEDPWIVFPGCIQGRHIRETGAKGCLLVTVDDVSIDPVIEMRSLDVLRWNLCAIDLTDVEDMREVWDLTRKEIQASHKSAGDRPVAMRIRYYGSTKMVDQISANPEHFAVEVKARGAEIAGEDVWIEKVENLVTGKRDLSAGLSDDSPLGIMLREIVNIDESPENIHGLDDVLTELKQKLPVEAYSDDGGLLLDDPDTMKHLIEEAKQMLVSKLLVEEKS